MNYKDRTLLVLKYLHDHSDERKSVSTRDIRTMLEKQGISATVQTIRRDIQAIQDAGFDISVNEEEGKLTRYNYVDRVFSEPEAQILVDAVASAQFLTAKKSRELINKLQEVTGPGFKKDMEPGISVSDQVKAGNEQILLVIQDVRRAIRHDRRISFLYMTHDVREGQIPKHQGFRYIVSPYATIWKEDRYYVIGWSERHGHVTVFRLDRISKLHILERSRKEEPADYNLQDYLDKAFRMYGNGREERVTLRCRNEMLDQIYDRFGTKAEIRASGSGWFEVTADVILSGTFYSWLFQYVGEIVLAAPESAAQEYARRLEEAMDDALGV